MKVEFSFKGTNTKPIKMKINSLEIPTGEDEVSFVAITRKHKFNFFLTLAYKLHKNFMNQVRLYTLYTVNVQIHVHDLL